MGVESNLPSRRGWTRSYFNFNSGGGGVQLYFKAYFANFRTPPPDNYCTVPNQRKLKLNRWKSSLKPRPKRVSQN